MAAELVAVLARHDIVEPFGIQTATLPDSLAGRDVLGRGPTGSGKTVAFALPLVTRLAARKPDAARAAARRARCWCPPANWPSRWNAPSHFLAKAVGLRTMTVYGGVGYPGQLKQPRRRRRHRDRHARPPRGPDRPRSRATCRDVQVTVLDEADLMADMGFLPPVRRLLDLTPPGQRLLFSATLDGDVDRLVRKYLHEPVTHSVEPAARSSGRAPRVPRHQGEPAARCSSTCVSGAGRSLVFARTKHGAARLAEQPDQGRRPRRRAARRPQPGRCGSATSTAFSEGRVRVLVATDVAARGIHVDDIALVVHADPPAEAKSFLHRSGRTARAGASGIVVTLCQRDQNRKVKAMMAAAGISNPRREVVEPGSDLIARCAA